MSRTMRRFLPVVVVVLSLVLVLTGLAFAAEVDTSCGCDPCPCATVRAEVVDHLPRRSRSSSSACNCPPPPPCEVDPCAPPPCSCKEPEMTRIPELTDHLPRLDPQDRCPMQGCVALSSDTVEPELVDELPPRAAPPTRARTKSQSESSESSTSSTNSASSASSATSLAPANSQPDLAMSVDDASKLLLQLIHPEAAAGASSVVQSSTVAGASSVSVPAPASALATNPTASSATNATSVAPAAPTSESSESSSATNSSASATPAPVAPVSFISISTQSADPSNGQIPSSTEDDHVDLSLPPENATSADIQQQLASIDAAQKALDAKEIENDEKQAQIRAAVSRLVASGNKALADQAMADQKQEEQSKRAVREKARMLRFRKRLIQETAQKRAELNRRQAARRKLYKERQRKLESMQKQVEQQQEQLVKQEALNNNKLEAVEKKQQHKADAPVSNTLTLSEATKGLGSGYVEPRVDHDGNVCYVSGVFTAADITQKVMTLNEDCLPRARHVIDQQVAKMQNTRVDVLTNGAITFSTTKEKNPAWATLDGTIIPSASAKLQNISLAAHWQSFGGGYQVAASLAENGLCLLTGVIRTTVKNVNDWNNVIGMMPSECAPSRRLVFKVNQQEEAHRVDVLPDGEVRWVSGNRHFNWLSLDGVAYPKKAEGSFTLINDWNSFGRGYRSPSFQVVGKVCFLTGLLAGPVGDDPHELLAVLPDVCRPAKRFIFGTMSSMGPARFDVLPDGRVMWMDEAFPPAPPSESSGASSEASSLLEVDELVTALHANAKPAPASSQDPLVLPKDLQNNLIAQKQLKAYKQALDESRKMAQAVIAFNKKVAAERKAYLAKHKAEVAKCRKETQAANVNYRNAVNAKAKHAKDLSAVRKQLASLKKSEKQLREKSLSLRQAIDNNKLRGDTKSEAGNTIALKKLEDRLQKELASIKRLTLDELRLKQTAAAVKKNVEAALVREKQAKVDCVTSRKAAQEQSQKRGAQEVAQKNNEATTEANIKKAAEQDQKDLQKEREQADAQQQKEEEGVKKRMEEESTKEQAAKASVEQSNKNIEAALLRKVSADEKDALEKKLKEQIAASAVATKRVDASKAQLAEAQKRYQALVSELENENKVKSDHIKEIERKSAAEADRMHKQEIEALRRRLAAATKRQKALQTEIEHLKQRADAEVALAKSQAEARVDQVQKQVKLLEDQRSNNTKIEEEARKVYERDMKAKDETEAAIRAKAAARVAEIKKQIAEVDQKVTVAKQQADAAIEQVNFDMTHPKVVEKVVTITLPPPPVKAAPDVKPPVPDAVANQLTAPKSILPRSLPETWLSLDGIHFPVA